MAQNHLINKVAAVHEQMVFCTNWKKSRPAREFSRYLQR